MRTYLDRPERLGRATALIIACLVMGTGCATKVPLTRGLLGEYSVTQPELRQLQYYVSDRIDLRREEKHVDKGREGVGLSGAAQIVREQVFVLPDTPGIAEAGDYESLHISFEKGSSFEFQWDPDEKHPRNGRYRLTPSRQISMDERLAQSVPMGLYVFDYRNKEYFSQQTENVFLKVELKDLLDIVEKRHRLKGRRVTSY